jgi:hypothetical protein
MATEKTPHDVVRLATAANPVEAHIFEQALKDEGIRCKVVGEFLDAGVGDIPGLNAEIWVHREDLSRATEILRRSKGEAKVTELIEPADRET